jgi:hypothetical protein
MRLLLDTNEYILVEADFLVSENRHFLRDLKTTAYRVVDAAEMLVHLEDKGTC